MNGRMGEAIAAQRKQAREDASIDLPGVTVHAIVQDGEDAIAWVPGQGLYVDATISGGDYDGETVRAVVGGHFFHAYGGGLYSTPVLPGDHVAIVLLEGKPEGHALLLSPVGVEDSAPPDLAGFRTLNEDTLRRFRFDVLPPGVGHTGGLTDASSYTRLREAEAGKGGNYTVQLPDGGVLEGVRDSINGGWTWKLKSGGGAACMVTSSSAGLYSPSREAWLEVTDAGVVVGGPFIRTQGPTLLDVGPGDSPAVSAVAFRPPGPPGIVAVGAAGRVYVGVKP